MNQEKEKPIFISITANLVTDCYQQLGNATHQSAKDMNNRVMEWLRLQAALKGWPQKKLNQYYKVVFESQTSIQTPLMITTYILPRLKGRGGRQPGRKEERHAD